MIDRMRDLPPLSTFADEILVALGGGRIFTIEEGKHPALAIAPIGRGFLLLVCDYGHILRLSLPVDTSWSVQTKSEWGAVREEVVRFVRAYPNVVTMADGIAKFAPVLTRLTGKRWTGSVPGTPLPTEMWLREAEGGSVGFFQEEHDVKVVVWVRGEMNDKMLASADEAWLVDAVKRQLEPQAPKPVLPVPDINEVLAALRAGKRFIVYAGRAGKTYVMEGDKLRLELYEEADHWSSDTTEGELAQDIERYPDSFRRNTVSD